MIENVIWIEAITQRPAIRDLHLEVGEALRLALEPLGQLVAAAHRLAEQDPGDRQRLLDERRHVGERPLHRAW